VPLLEKYPIIDIRGRGLMSALEFGGRDGSLDAEPGTAGKVVRACAERGMLILSAGT
jgi:4-aminobutyrate aminotransferase-like enzyme